MLIHHRYYGIISHAEPRRSFTVRRLDGGPAVTLSRAAANETNYRLRLGDRIIFSVYHDDRGTSHAFGVALDDPKSDRPVIHKTPPYYALGPVIRVGGWR
jgi:hypothetical protein